VSGDTVFLRDDPAGNVAALVRATGTVAAHAGVPVALIGGLAVMCRISTGTRATGDVDVVSDTQADLVGGASAADNLVGADLARRDPGSESIRLWLGPTKVEIIETQAVAEADAVSIEPELSRLFVLAHRWALETATPMTLSAIGTDVSAEIRVAVPAALVAMKLHSIHSRTDERKRASDAWDLARLLDAHNADGAISRALGAGPAGLGALVTTQLRRAFVDDVTRTRRRLVVYGDPSWSALLSEDRLIALAEEI
jgi:Nucleotidyl transferase AbiEii toxin, Type IV TA system